MVFIMPVPPALHCPDTPPRLVFTFFTVPVSPRLVFIMPVAPPLYCTGPPPRLVFITPVAPPLHCPGQGPRPAWHSLCLWLPSLLSRSRYSPWSSLCLCPPSLLSRYPPRLVFIMPVAPSGDAPKGSEHSKTRFSNILSTFCQHYVNILSTLCQHFVPAVTEKCFPLQPQRFLCLPRLTP